MIEWILNKLCEITSAVIKATFKLRQRMAEDETRQGHAIKTFLTTFTPHASGLRTLVGSWPGEDGAPVETDVNAGTALVNNLRQILNLRHEEIVLIDEPLVLRDELMDSITNAGLLGGPSGNPVCRAAIGFKGPFRNELSVDNQCPLWTHGALKYYSISNYRELSAAGAIKEFDDFLHRTGVRNSRIPGLVWGITQRHATRPSIRRTDNEWTLLLTRMPNFFSEDSIAPTPSQALMIIDGVHGEATEAFRLLFKEENVALLEQINEAVRDSTVFQVPFVLDMSGREVKCIRIDHDRCPIHVWDKDDRGLRTDVHQYVLHRMDELFGTRE